MNNEEKNLTPENEGSEEVVAAEGKKGLSGGVLIGIIAAAICVVVAVILLIVLLPGNNDSGDGGNNDDGNNGDGSGNVDPQPETDVTYSVTVVDQDGNPVKGAMVYFYGNGSGIDVPFPTNKDGVASYKTDKGVASVSLFTLPTGYEYVKLGQKQDLDSDNKLTITVTKKAEENTGVSYTVRVVDQNGDAVVGAMVQMCSDRCFPLDPTDENGESVSIRKQDDFKAQIVSLPDGYTDITNGEYQLFSGDAEGGFTVTIVVTKN